MPRSPVGASTPFNTKPEQSISACRLEWWGGERGESLASFPLFLTQIPIHKCRDTGKSFIKHTTVYSGMKKKKFPSVSRV